MAMDLPPRLLEVAHVAHRLSVGHPFVRALIHSGKLRATRIGKRWRVDEGDLKRYEEAQRPPQARRASDAPQSRVLHPRNA